MRIAIGEVQHETNTFSNISTTVDVFKLYEWEHGDGIIHTHTGVRDYLGGMISKGNQLRVDLVPTFSARANPSGIITKETYEKIKEELFTSLRKESNLDAICLSLHGAGVAENTFDLEGDLLKELRTLVGYEIPIICTLDLHANLTERMVTEADILLGVNHYPHTDCYERGLEAIELAVGMVKNQIKPIMHLTKIPLMIPSSTTYNEPANHINEKCWEWEKESEVIDCTFFHSFSHTDAPTIGVSVLTVTNDNKDLAKKVSEDVCKKIWNVKEDFFIERYTPIQGLNHALSVEGRPIVINETSDNPGGGAPGDGTYLLEAMIEKNIPDSCFGFIYDPEAAEKAHKAGVGACIDLELGGKTDTIHGKTLSIKAYIQSLSDGNFTHTSKMLEGKKATIGKSARLKVDNVDIIVASIRTQTFDEQIFLLHGIDVIQYKIVALKSSQHFRAAFQKISREIITVDSRGLSSNNLDSFNYKRVNRPIFPLDQI
jgi:microcystin degradation protein MlrC